MPITKKVREIATQKRSQTVSQKLIPRLARYLWDDSLYGKSKVRALLKKGGYRGPKWKDEARAIAILVAAGHDMSKFERFSSKSIPSIAAPARISLSPEARTAVHDAERLKSIRIYLMQARKAMLKENFNEMAGCLLLALGKVDE